jgi:hypothetical protein
MLLVDALERYLFSTIISEWIGSSQDLLSLDVAICNREVRHVYYSCPKVIGYLIVVKEDKFLPFKKWKDERNFTIKRIEMKCTRNQSEITTNFGSGMDVLLYLDLKPSKSVRGIQLDLTNLFTNLPNLISLQLKKVKINFEGNRGTRSHPLERLECTQCSLSNSLSTNNLLALLEQTCHHLRHIKFDSLPFITLYKLYCCMKNRKLFFARIQSLHYEPYIPKPRSYFYYDPYDDIEDGNINTGDSDSDDNELDISATVMLNVFASLQIFHVVHTAVETIILVDLLRLMNPLMLQDLSINSQPDLVISERHEEMQDILRTFRNITKERIISSIPRFALIEHVFPAWKNLTSLIVAHVQITDKLLQLIGRFLPVLSDFQLQYCIHITDEGIRHFLQEKLHGSIYPTHNLHFKQLYINHCRHLTLESYENILNTFVIEEIEWRFERNVLMQLIWEKLGSYKHSSLVKKLSFQTPTFYSQPMESLFGELPFAEVVDRISIAPWDYPQLRELSVEGIAINARLVKKLFIRNRQYRDINMFVLTSEDRDEISTHLSTLMKSCIVRLYTNS